MNNGGPHPPPLTMRVCELLDDMKWHPFDEIAREAGKVITPGRAIRKAERQRRKAVNAPPERRYQREEHRLIESGKRAMVRETLFGAYWENATIDGVRSVRMTALPPRVRAARARQHLLEGDLITILGNADDPAALLDRLTRDELYEVALELASRERERVLSARLLSQ